MVASVDPRWSYRAWSNNHHTVINIPKVASNTLSNDLVYRAGWHDVKYHTTPTAQFHVVLRDPIERFKGCMAEHLSHKIQHGASLADITKFIQSRRWMARHYVDMHLFSQTTYCDGVNLANTHWHRLEAGLDTLYDDLALPRPSKLNSGIEAVNNRNVLRDVMNNIWDTELTDYIADLYADDYTLMNLVTWRN